MKKPPARHLVEGHDSRYALALNVSRMQRTERDEHRPAGQRALAERLGIGEGTVARIQAMRANLTLDRLDEIARAAKVRTWELLLLPGETPMLSNGHGHLSPVFDELVQVSPEQQYRIGPDMELPKAAIDVALAWLALPERERNEFKRQIEAAAAPHRDPPPGDSADSGTHKPTKAALKSVRRSK